MSTENVKIKVRNRTIEVKWIAQYCDHIMDNYINDHSRHDLNFQQISDMLRKASFDNERGRIWRAYGIFNGVKYLAILILTPKFAIVKTCYRNEWTI